MTTRTRRRVAVLGATLLLALALAGPAAATAQAAGTAPGGRVAATTAAQTLHPGRSAGTLGPNPPAPSAASVLGAIAVTIVAVGIISFLLLSLGRRDAVRPRSVESSGPVNGASSSKEVEDEERKAA